MRSNLLSDAMGEIKEEYITDAHEYSRRNYKSKMLVKLSAAAACICLLVTCAVPALAASDVEAAYKMMYSISPSAAQKLKPVRMSCEDKGIRMEVLSAYIHGDSAQIQIALRDLEEDRIDETTDLFDSYSINKPFSCAATCSLKEYDRDTKTALLLISITQFGGRDITGDKITFSLKRILSGKDEFDGEFSKLDLAHADKTPSTQTIKIRGYAGTDTQEKEPGDRETFLMPLRETAFSPVKGVQITAAGWIDGKLHIQAHYDDILNTDNHGYVYLKSDEGEEISCSYNVSFWDEEKAGSYEEYVFDTSEEELKGCKAYGCFVTSGRLTEGNWQVTFPIDK